MSENMSFGNFFVRKCGFGKFGVGKFGVGKSVSENLLSEKSPWPLSIYIIYIRQKLESNFCWTKKCETFLAYVAHNSTHFETIHIFGPRLRGRKEEDGREPVDSSCLEN